MKLPISVLLASFLPSVASAATVLDFESPLPPGLIPTSYIQGTQVPTESLVTDQYLSAGIVISNAALIAAGFGHAASGQNALAGVNAAGSIDYGQSVSFSFFAAGNRAQSATASYFSYSPDLAGGSNNTVTISAFDEFGAFLGQVSYVETGTFSSPLSISGVGRFHTVTVTQTLLNAQSGGIALDLVSYDALQLTSAVPEPSSMLMTVVGCGLIGGLATRRRSRLKSGLEISGHSVHA